MAEPGLGGFGQGLAAVWRTLRSMRTALLLLLLVGAASVVGSLVPQAPISPAQVARIFEEHPLRAAIFDALGLFDVYGSWWFTLTYVLLLISLGSCLGPRTRGFVRGLRQRAQPARDLVGMRHYAAATVEGGAEEALGRARSLLRRRRYRVGRPAPGETLAAEKGVGREVGSLLFHWAFFLLLLGAAYGVGFGFRGQVTVVEGQAFTEGHASYDLPPREGRFFAERHAGFQVRVREFEATYRETGLPRDFVSRVDVIEDGELVRREEIRVNRPLRHRGVKVYQAGYGWAPVIEIRRDGEVLASGPVVFVTDNANDLRTPWRGVVKLPGLEPDVGLEFQLLPDPAAFLAGAPMLHARGSFLSYTAYRGDLRLDRVQSVFTLDKTGLVEWESGGVGMGGEAELPGGLTIGFPELREYTRFLVARDPGQGIMLLAALLILLGLLPALFSSRRRIWVRATPGDGGTRIEVAGVAFERKAAFDEEFARLARDLTEGPVGRVASR